MPRLIDADKLSRKSCAFGTRKNCESCGEVKTIPNIPCNEIRLDFLRMIDKAPTVEAIPIEWIDSYITDSDIGLRANDPIKIKIMLEDWKEENGQ